jgi:hypothetical protein
VLVYECTLESISKEKKRGMRVSKKHPRIALLVSCSLFVEVRFFYERKYTRARMEV